MLVESQSLDQRAVWIIGSGGFLGSALKKATHLMGYVEFDAKPIAWTNAEIRKKSLESNISDFADFAKGRNKTIIWAAGQGSVSSLRESNISEISALSNLVEALATFRGLYGTQVVVCSSAGGVYSGAPSPPFTKDTTPIAINPYGYEKIQIENLVVSSLLPHYQVVLSRITNLYGEWSGDRQGLVNRLCTAAIIREPIQIYVPLETVRDYINVNDAARILLLEAAYLTRISHDRSVDTCILGSGRSSSVGDVIKVVSDVSKRKVPMSFADLELTSLQPRDLRVVPTWIERGLCATPLDLPVGIKLLLNSLVTQPRWI